MKTYKYIALAALGFAACAQDDDFAPQQEDIVKIASANIATEVQTRVNTLGGGAEWEENDRIILVNNSRTSRQIGTYTYNGTAWDLTYGIVCYASSGTNDFTAYYPNVQSFNLPQDQSNIYDFKFADRMVATANGVAKSDAVALSFERQNAKVSITLVFATQYEDKTIGDITDFKIGAITPYLPEGGNTYTAIIEPSGNGFSVSLTVGEDELTATSVIAIKAGKHYSFNLTVGKNKLGLGSVKIVSWNEGGNIGSSVVEVN